MCRDLKVVMPSNPADAKGLLKAAIRDDNPVVFIEHRGLYWTRGQVPEGEHLVPIGKAAVAREGEDLTIVATAKMLPAALEAAEELSPAVSPSKSSTRGPYLRWMSKLL